jgi:hypothetical protein
VEKKTRLAISLQIFHPKNANHTRSFSARIDLFSLFHIRKEESAMAEETCPKCKMPKKDWKAFAGNGYTYPKDGQKYCCRGCTDGSGCTCK